MKRLPILLTAVATFGLVAGDAFAQCSFDGPADGRGVARTRQFKTTMIRSFAGCPSNTFLSPNSQTGTGVPTCAPPYAHSTYQFHNKNGSCRFRLRGLRETPCSDGSGGDCANMRIRSRCKGVLEADGQTLTEDPGWSISTVSRATLDDPDNGDMTVIDFPVQISYSAPKKGRFKAKTDTNTLLAGLGLAALPGCTELEVLGLTVKDPLGRPFATVGAGVRAKGT